MNQTIEFWVMIGLRVGTLVIAIVAGVIAWRTFRNNRRHNERSAWFDRVRWALELTNGPSGAEVALGWSILPTLMDHAHSDDADIAEAVRNYTVSVLYPADQKHPELPDQPLGLDASTLEDSEHKIDTQQTNEGGEGHDSSSARRQD